MNLYDIVAPMTMAEAQTDYQKRRQRERDVDAGRPVTKPRTSKQTDYQKKRAQDKRDTALGEMDKSQKGAAGWNIDDYDYTKGKWSQGKPVSAKQATSDMEKELTKAFDRNKEPEPSGIKKKNEFNVKEDSWHAGDNAWSSENHEMVEGQLRVGDPVVVTAANEFEGKTGEIDEFSPSGKFVIVNLYNYGRQSMHLSDVEYNQYADQEVDEHIGKVKGGYRLYSKHGNKNLGTFPTRAGAEKHEREVQYFKHADEGVEEGWSDAIVAQRTGQPRTPYSVYIKGKKWKDFENDDHARAVMSKLIAKFKAEGRDPSVITIAPTDYDKGMDEALSKKDLFKQVGDKLNDPKFRKQPADSSKRWERGDLYQGPGPDDYGYTGYQGHGMPRDNPKKKKGVAEAGSPAQQAAIAIAKKKEHGVDEGKNNIDAKIIHLLTNGIPAEAIARKLDIPVEWVHEVAEYNMPDSAVDSTDPRNQQPTGRFNEVKQRLDAKCWTGYKKQGTKIKGGVRVNNCVPKESVEDLEEEFDLIESIIDNLAERNNVDAEVIWEDLESLTDDELYVFATTTPVMEDWQKANKKDKTDGMSRKAVKAYRREHPGSKLKTAVTTKPSKLKKGSKASKRRKSYCSRSKGQMNMHNISCAKTPDKAICKARRRWNCEESYWNKLKEERSTKLNSLLTELEESIKDL